MSIMLKKVRIANEPLFFSGNLSQHLNTEYFKILLNVLILKFFSLHNIYFAKKKGLKFSDCFIGVLYTGNMNERKCIKVINKFSKKYKEIEILFHPSEYHGSLKEKYFSSFSRNYCLHPNRKKELQTLLSKTLIKFLSDRKLLNKKISFKKSNKEKIKKIRRICCIF